MLRFARNDVKKSPTRPYRVPYIAVAGVAEARHDVAVVVEVLVDRGGPDRHVGMRAVQPRDALGRGEQADEADVLGAALLQPVDGGDGGVGGRQHRVDAR